jgi:hypothetical protein
MRVDMRDDEESVKASARALPAHDVPLAAPSAE